MFTFNTKIRSKKIAYTQAQANIICVYYKISLKEWLFLYKRIYLCNKYLLFLDFITTVLSVINGML